MRQLRAAELMFAAQALGHASEDLGSDDAGVAARAHQRPVADRLGDAIGVLVGHGLRLGQCGADRGQHVAARVAVRDREDVEGVDLVDVRGKVVHAHSEGRQQAGSVSGSARHRLTRVVI